MSTSKQETATATRRTKREGGALRFQTAPAPASAKQTNTAHYWIGVVEGCPIQNVTVGGMTFHTRTFSWVREGDEPRQSPKVGQIVPLSEAQVEKIRDSLVTSDGQPRKMMRAIGAADAGRPRRGVIVSTDARYVAQANDTPLTQWLYMERVEEGSGIPGRKPVPLSG